MSVMRITHYITKCPFCGGVRKQKLYLNSICLGCNAKFYYRDFTWLNRATGEKFYMLHDVTFVSEEENERA